MNESNMKPFTSDLVDSPAAWYGRDLQNDDSWIELLTDAEVDEIQHAIKRVNSQRISMLEMKREDFPLPTLGNRLQGMARELDHGRGFWLLRGLPLDALGERDAAFAYWGIGLHLGRPVSQNARGHLLGHVTDEGVDFRKDSGARGYQTRLTTSLPHRQFRCCWPVVPRDSQERRIEQSRLYHQRLQRSRETSPRSRPSLV